MTEVATRQRIHDSAITLFAERGYAAVSTTDIAVAAGVAQPTIYYHFGNKLQLFRECVATAFKGLTDHLEVTSDIAHLDPVDQLQVAMRRFGHALVINHDLCRLFFRGAPVEELQEHIAEVLHPGVKQFRQMLEELLASGRIRPVNPVVVIEAYAGSLMEITAFREIHHHIHGIDFADTRQATEFVNEMVDFIVGGLVSPT